MDQEEIEAWLNSYSMGFHDRKGRLVKNGDAEELLKDINYRVVASDRFSDQNGNEIHVSTVFLGIPHIGSHTDEMVEYETMIFGGKYDKWQHRWKNAGIAAKAHGEIVKALRNDAELPFDDTNIITKFIEAIKSYLPRKDGYDE
jgi:hypothetical protein